jgi:hypothetical protein
MKEESDALEAAAAVYFGTWSDPAELELVEFPETPESIYLKKEVIQSMPSECQTMLNIIFNLPEEMFQISGGKVNLYGAMKVVKNMTGWPMKKVLRTETLLREQLRNS